jgi:hypothetical protein
MRTRLVRAKRRGACFVSNCGARNIVSVRVEMLQALFLKQIDDGRRCVSPWMRTLAMVLSQTRLATWIQLNSLNSRPRKKFFFT